MQEYLITTFPNLNEEQCQFLVEAYEQFEQKVIENSKRYEKCEIGCERCTPKPSIDKYYTRSPAGGGITVNNQWVLFVIDNCDHIEIEQVHGPVKIEMFGDDLYKPVKKAGSDIELDLNGFWTLEEIKSILPAHTDEQQITITIKYKNLIDIIEK